MSLLKKINAWVENGLINEKQGTEILKFEQNNNTGKFWRITYIIAGLLIGLGICLLVASNWDEVPVSIKLLGDFAILGAFIYGIYDTTIKQKKGLKELFLVLSFLMIGATIGLMGQIFNLEGGWTNFATAWALLGLPFVLFSRSMTFNFMWLCLFFSLFRGGLIQKLFRFLSEDFFACVYVILGLCLLGYAGKKLNEICEKYTLIPKAFSHLALFLAYISVWIMGIYWGMSRLPYFPKNSLANMIMANLFVFVFYGGRMLMAVKKQEMSSFKRNALWVELYTFALFASRFGNLFVSGVGFILGGLLILGMIYLLKKTSKFIKNMEVFKNE